MKKNIIESLQQSLLKLWIRFATKFWQKIKLKKKLLKASKSADNVSKHVFLGLLVISLMCRRDDTVSHISHPDPTYVNNPEMSDVQFRVEGRVFYAHKIILVNASPRFKAMLAAKSVEGAPPVVQINDIRYDIFQVRSDTFLISQKSLVGFQLN